MSTLNIAAKRCNECLLTRNRIVPEPRAKEIIQKCLKTGKPFECHKYTARGERVRCRGFYDKFKNDLLLFRLANQLGLVREIP